MNEFLATEYGGLELRSPLIIGACPLTAQDSMWIPICNSGAGAIVLPSLFQEQVDFWNLENGFRSIPLIEDEEDLFRKSKNVSAGTVCENAEAYLDLVERASSQLPIPVIASLHGECVCNWSDYALELQAAGAAGVELNVQHPAASQKVEPQEIESRIVQYATAISKAISIPLFLKLGNNYTSISHLARCLNSNAQGLVLFGKAPQADICIENLRATSNWKLSKPDIIPPSIETLMQIRKCCPQMALAASGGVSTSSDLIKVLLAGADVAMVTSGVYRDGPTVIGTMLEGLTHFMERHHVQSLPELKSRIKVVADAEQSRIAHAHALSSGIDVDDLQESGRTIEGDRWGHPQSPK